MASPGRPRSFDRDVALSRAMKLFWERGYEAVSLADLTHELGINKPSIYAAFGSKEGLFREAVELYAATEGCATQNAMRDEPTARAAVEAMLRNNARVYTSADKPRGCMVLLAASVGSSENHEVRAYLATLRTRARALIEARVRRAILEGDVVGTADARRVALFYMSVLCGMSAHARDGLSYSELEPLVDDALAAWDVVAGPSSAPPCA